MAGGVEAVVAKRGECHRATGAAHNDEFDWFVWIGGLALADQRVELLNDPHTNVSTGTADRVSRDAVRISVGSVGNSEHSRALLR